MNTHVYVAKCDGKHGKDYYMVARQRPGGGLIWWLSRWGWLPAFRCNSRRYSRFKSEMKAISEMVIHENYPKGLEDYTP